MVRNSDEVDKGLARHIAKKPGLTFSELRNLLQIPSSTFRYRPDTLQLAGLIIVKKTRNGNAYYLTRREGGTL